MPMPPYQVYCYRKGCGKPAVYKIAARWSDGVTHELKTYSLTCGDCLPDFFKQSQIKFAACRRAPGEMVEPPGIYSLQRGVRDVEISRQPDLEEQLTTGLPPGSTA
ncbi:hypothetical protein BH10PLA2_BH10PLA2_15700 [soil metagenome]